MKRWLLLLGIFLPCTWSYAQSSKVGPFQKLTDDLVSLHQEYASHVAQRSAPPFKSSNSAAVVTDEYVVVDAVAVEDPTSLQADLTALGMKDPSMFGRIVSGPLPISSIPAAANLKSLKFARTAQATTRAGTVTSQGDHAMRSDVARTSYGVNGTGVTVGVLSDSFDCLGGAATDVASGDLSPVNVISEISGCSGAGDEGRAMLQIVHDVAPGSSLAFASAFNGEAAFAANIQALAAAGAKVIVDDVIYFSEPFFQDGIIAQAVNSVVAGGAAYFSAAGNEARQSYQSAFRPGDVFADGAIPSGPNAPHFFGGTAHNFRSSGGKDHFQSITVPGLATVRFIFQWDSPFFSVSGAPGSPNDLDIYILNAAANQVLAGSAFDSVGGDALEILAYTNNSPTPVTINLMIVKYSGADPGLIKYVRFGSATINEFDTQSGTIFGHPNASAAEAVGAVRYTSTPVYGISPPLKESFSSSGTTPILFDIPGNRLAFPDTRGEKPEIMAPDGADTTFFGSDTDGDGFPNFFGTSAAAPHAAAVAALFFQLSPRASPLRVYEALERSAIDMASQGFDNDTGYGLIDAPSALSLSLRRPLTDFDGDFRSDVGIYRNGAWLIVRSSDGTTTNTVWGGASWTPVPGDYDGDGITDLAVYNGTGVWSIIRSSDGGNTLIGWNAMAGDVPVPGDYDGDGRTDIAIYNPSTAVWSILRSSDGTLMNRVWGGPSWQPVVADYDGDGKTDVAVYNSSGLWSILRSSDGGNTLIRWSGAAGDIPVPADYDGDGKADFAIYNSATAFWSIIRSSDGGLTVRAWGGPSWQPAVADYDGDGKADIAVYRSTNGLWSILRSSDAGNTLLGWGGGAQDIALH